MRILQTVSGGGHDRRRRCPRSSAPGRPRRRPAQGDRRRRPTLRTSPTRTWRTPRSCAAPSPPGASATSTRAPPRPRRGSSPSSPTRTPRSSSADREPPGRRRRRRRCRTTASSTTASTSRSWSPRRREQAAAAARLVEVDYEPADAAARPRRPARRAADQPVGHRHAARRRRRRPRLRRGHATRRPTRPRRTPTTRSACSRPSPPGTATPSPCTTPPSGPSNVRACVAATFGVPEAAVRVHAPYRRRRLRRRPARLAARDPDGARRARGRTAGQARPHPAADVHRHRPPTQHGPDAQARRHARRQLVAIDHQATAAWRSRTTSIRAGHAGPAPAPTPARTSPPATSSAG